MKDHALIMVTRQHELNQEYCARKFNDKDWLGRAICGEWNYRLAAIEELIELANSLPYAWWKKGTPDFTNLKVEFIDFLHFYMSVLIQDCAVAAGVGIHDKGFDAVLSDAGSKLGYWLNSSVNADPDFSKVSVTNVVTDLIGSICSSSSTHFISVSALAALVGLSSLTHVYVLYLAKAALNELRSSKGYMGGTYSRTWGDRDDNDVVFSHVLTAEFLNNTEVHTLTGMKQVVEELHHTYGGAR